MKILASIADLTPAELARVRETLATRFGLGRRGNILEIGFGMATVRGRPDPRRGDAICFYVRHKRMPRAKRDRIPPTVDVRLKRGPRFVLVRLPSDVVSVGPRTIRPTGRRIRHLSRPRESAVAGCVVAWNTEPQQRLSWGIITVGHLFHQRRRLPEGQKKVRLQVARSPTREISGTLLARSTSNDGSRVDAALVQVVRDTLERVGLLPRDASTAGKVVRSVAELPTDGGVPGVSLPERRRIPLVVQRYLPTCRLVPELGPLADAIDVISDESQAFGGGAREVCGSSAARPPPYSSPACPTISDKAGGSHWIGCWPGRGSRLLAWKRWRG